MTTTIYRLVSIDCNNDAKFIDQNFYGKNVIEDAISDYCDRLKRWGNNPTIQKYNLHPFQAVRVDGDGLLSATILKKITFCYEMCGNNHTKEIMLGYVGYKLEA